MIRVALLLLALLALPCAAMATPAILFSDMPDGATSGWEGSATKGAAVSIWGYEFGTSRDGGSLTVCGVTLNQDSDFAEWGATTNPTTASSQQRITFWLKSSMQTGDQTIQLTNGNGTSNTIPFHCRELGTNHIYFLSSDGDDSNDGLTIATPWKTATKIRSMVAGDVTYMRGGIYDYKDPQTISGTVHYAFIAFYNPAPSYTPNYNNGSSGKSITLAAYPGELAQVGNGEEIGRIVQYMIYLRPYLGTSISLDYWNFSKIHANVRHGMTAGTLTFNAGIFNNIRFTGCDVDSSYSGSGTGIGFVISGANHMKLLGNYIHHMGMGNPPAKPTVSSGAGAGLTGTYKAVVTFGGSSSAGSRSGLLHESLPSTASDPVVLSDNNLAVSWSGLNTGSYNTLTVWRTKAGGSTYYLDQSFSVSSATGTVEVSTLDVNLGKEVDFNGFNSTTYYRAGMPFYFNGYGTQDDIELAYNEIAYSYSGGQFFGHTVNDKLDNLHVHSNYIHHNDRRGMTIGGGDGGTYNFIGSAYVYNNIFHGNESGLQLTSEDHPTPAHFYVYNNTFYKNQKLGGEIELWLVCKSTTTMDFRNNIFVANPIAYGYISYHTGVTAGYTGVNNIWYGEGNGPSWDTNPFNGVEPTFENSTPAAFSDFKLQLTSVGVNNGVSSVSDVVSEDFILVARPQGSAFDIGAFEYEEDIPSPGLPFIGSGGTFTLGTGGTIYLQ